MDATLIHSSPLAMAYRVARAHRGALRSAAMEPPRPSSPALFAPGAPSHGAYAPGQGQRLPAVDDRLVAPESHAEIVDGRVYRTMGANPPHATQHAEVTHVFAGVLAQGFSVAVDMLTRADEESDAAPDVSIFPSAPDPTTGGRQIEPGFRASFAPEGVRVV